MVLNEPTAFTLAGYFAKYHAPGLFGPNKFLKSVHHAAMAQAEGGRVIRANVPDARIGSTFSCSTVEPKKDVARHRNAAHRLDIILNRLFIEPVLGLGYPTDDFGFISRIDKHMLAGDEALLKFDFDFIGLQNYTRFVTKHFMIPYVWGI